MDELKELVLSTHDNPYNPKTDYNSWKQWDEDNGYYTESYVARVMDMLGDFDVDDEIRINELTEKAIQEIIEIDNTGTYVLV